MVSPQYEISYRVLPDDVGPIRPPSESESLLIRVNRNCPWNKCKFCTIYRGNRFEIKSPEEIKAEIGGVRAYYDAKGWKIPYTTAFLQDGNALAMKPRHLADVIRHLKQQFPSIDTVTTYSSSLYVSGIKQQDLDDLAEAGLSKVHIGMESGSAAVLKDMNKGATPEMHVEAGKKLIAAKIKVSEYVLYGLGGQERSIEHAEESAKVLNQINPDYIRSRRLTVGPGNELYSDVENGTFVQVGDEGIVREQQILIGGLEGVTSEYHSDHIKNPLPELEGKLPQDKQKMLYAIDRFFALSEEERKVFLFGRRTIINDGVLFGELDHLHRSSKVYNILRDGLREHESEHPGGFDELIFEMLAKIGG